MKTKKKPLLMKQTIANLSAWEQQKLVGGECPCSGSCVSVCPDGSTIGGCTSDTVTEVRVHSRFNQACYTNS